MKVVVNCWNHESFQALVALKVEKIRIGIKNFSMRFNDYFDLDQLKQLIAIKQDSLISVAINRFFKENELIELEKIIKQLANLEIDEIVFADLAICQIVYENNLKIKLHYNPETIITNYEQLYFYNQNGINNFTISNGLMNHEVIEMIKNKKTSQLELQVFGQTLFMYSYWPLISNFKDYLKTQNEKLPNEKYYVIQEETRDIPNYLLEEKFGTSMYSGFILNLSKKLKVFQDLNLDYIFIESLFKDITWLEKIVIVFQDIIANKISGVEAYEKLVEIDSSLIHSESFLGDISKLPSFQRSEDA